MCGRYQFSAADNDDLRRIVKDVQRRCGQNELNFRIIDGDVCPASTAPVLISKENRVIGDLQKWGIPGPKGRLIINARAETVTQKTMFRRSIAVRRCVVPATAFYEWDVAHHPYLFSLPDSPVWLAGVYDCVEGANCFVILTTAPNASVAPVHDRMPLTLLREQIRPWLTDAEAALALLGSIPQALICSAKDGQIAFSEYI